MKLLATSALIFSVVLPLISYAFSPTLEVDRCINAEHLDLSEEELAKCPEHLEEFRKSAQAWEDWNRAALEDGKKNWFERLVQKITNVFVGIWPW